MRCYRHVDNCLKDKKKTTIENLAAGDGVLPIAYEDDAREMAKSGIAISKIHNILANRSLAAGRSPTWTSKASIQ